MGKKSFVSQNVTCKDNHNPGIKTVNLNRELNNDLDKIIENDLIKENNIQIEREFFPTLKKKSNKKLCDYVNKKSFNHDKPNTNLAKNLNRSENLNEHNNKEIEALYMVKESLFLSKKDDEKTLDSVFFHEPIQNDDFGSKIIPANTEQNKELKSFLESNQSTKSFNNTDTKFTDILNNKKMVIDKTETNQNTNMITISAQIDNFKSKTCAKKNTSLNDPLLEFLNSKSSSLVKKNIEHFEKINKFNH